MTEYSTQYLCTPAPEDLVACALFLEYHTRAENFDRSLPGHLEKTKWGEFWLVDPRFRGQSTRHAASIRREIEYRAKGLGVHIGWDQHLPPHEQAEAELMALRSRLEPKP